MRVISTRENTRFCSTRYRIWPTHGEPVDVITVTAKLQSTEGALEAAGGTQYIASLAALMPTALHVQHYANIISEKAMLRRMIATASEFANSGYSGAPAVDVLAEAERKIMELSQNRRVRDFTHISDVLETTFERIEQLYNSEGQITGVPTGYSDLDRMTSGFQKSDLIIVAARPSVGKTAFVLNISQNIAVREGLTGSIAGRASGLMPRCPRGCSPRRHRPH